MNAVVAFVVVGADVSQLLHRCCEGADSPDYRDCGGHNEHGDGVPGDCDRDGVDDDVDGGADDAHFYWDFDDYEERDHGHE